MTLRLAIAAAAAAAALALLPGPGTGAARPAPAATAAPASAATYAVSLGDSLSVGYQPGRPRTREGYADRLLELERRRPGRAALRLVQLGCPGETSGTLARGGGACAYPQGSQLRQAEWFLRRNRGRVAYVTITVGANDVLRCGPVDPACARDAVARIDANLSEALRRLRRAAGPGVRTVGADYYAPGLAVWLTGPSGRERARAYADELVAPGNAALRTTYARHGARVARVEAAFSTHDFSETARLPGVGAVPWNVAEICRLTWMCTRGDIHANADGYRVIAQAFARQLR